MSERSLIPVTGRRSFWTVDVAVFSLHPGALVVRTVPVGKSGLALPSGVPQRDETLERCARRLVRDACGTEASWVEQVGAFGDGRRHPVESELSVLFIAVLVGDIETTSGWLPPGELGNLAPRQRVMADTALVALRSRLDHAPIAFRLLPSRFTLTDLQRVYEMLLGHRLHKASFRRALQAAWLVEATDTWRSEGRGRPAQLYRYAPKPRRREPRGVRFDRLP
jgi:8-oxo-dGTP diphosphatase